MKKFSNPLTALPNLLFGTKLEMGSFFTTFRENVRLVRAQVRKHVQDRKKGIT